MTAYVLYPPLAIANGVLLFFAARGAVRGYGNGRLIPLTLLLAAALAGSLYFLFAVDADWGRWVAAERSARGHECSENTVAELMREHAIRAKAPRRSARTTDSRHGLPVADNVLGRGFAPAGPNAAWATDITYVQTTDGWLYLADVEDLFCRPVVGWSMDGTMTSRLVVDALEMAIRQRVPGDGLVAHSDRGSQYASDHYRRLLDRHGIACSMSRVDARTGSPGSCQR